MIEGCLASFKSVERHPVKFQRAVVPCHRPAQDNYNFMLSFSSPKGCPMHNSKEMFRWKVSVFLSQSVYALSQRYGGHADLSFWFLTTWDSQNFNPSGIILLFSLKKRHTSPKDSGQRGPPSHLSYGSNAYSLPFLNNKTSHFSPLDGPFGPPSTFLDIPGNWHPLGCILLLTCECNSLLHLQIKRMIQNSHVFTTWGSILPNDFPKDMYRHTLEILRVLFQTMVIKQISW